MQRMQTKGHCCKRAQDLQVIFSQHTAGSWGSGQEPAPVVTSTKFPYCSPNKSFLIPLLARRVMKQLQLQILSAELIHSLVSSYPLTDLPQAYTLQQGDDGSVLRSSGISRPPGAAGAHTQRHSMCYPSSASLGVLERPLVPEGTCMFHPE